MLLFLYFFAESPLQHLTITTPSASNICLEYFCHFDVNITRLIIRQTLLSRKKLGYESINIKLSPVITYHWSLISISSYRKMLLNMYSIIICVFKMKRKRLLCILEPSCCKKVISEPKLSKKVMSVTTLWSSLRHLQRVGSVNYFYLPSIHVLTLHKHNTSQWTTQHNTTKCKSSYIFLR